MGCNQVLCVVAYTGKVRRAGWSLMGMKTTFRSHIHTKCNVKCQNHFPRWFEWSGVNVIHAVHTWSLQVVSVDKITKTTWSDQVWTGPIFTKSPSYLLSRVRSLPGSKRALKTNVCYKLHKHNLHNFFYFMYMFYIQEYPHCVLQLLK